MEQKRVFLVVFLTIVTLLALIGWSLYIRCRIQNPTHPRTRRRFYNRLTGTLEEMDNRLTGTLEIGPLGKKIKKRN